MTPNKFDELLAYMGSVWDRIPTHAMRGAGWKLLKGLPDEAVEGAVVAIAEEGREKFPSWSIVYKAAQVLSDSMRDRTPALPAGDTMTDQEHRGAMVGLKAGNKPESARRVARCEEIKQLPQDRWLPLLRTLRTGVNERLPGAKWDEVFDEVMATEFKLRPPVAAGPSIHD